MSSDYSYDLQEHISVQALCYIIFTCYKYVLETILDEVIFQVLMCECIQI